MRAKVFAFVEILVVLVLIISPQMIVARGLVQTSNTGTASPALSPKPFCDKKIYSSCIPRPKRRCNYKNKCAGGPPPLPTTKTQP